MSRLRMGVIAAGNIAAAFVDASSAFKAIDIVAIASREQAKADAFAARFSLPKAYGSYAELIADPEIDAVYIATPNHSHKEWAIEAARAGKHVLCEKPMALTVADVEEMFAAARASGVRMIEGFPYRFQPQFLAVLDKIRKGELGEIITVTGCFGFRMRNDTNVRMYPELGGGATWDVGVYPLNLVRAVMGRAPVRASASATMHANGVDMTTTAVLEYEGWRSCSIWSSFESATFRRANIVGSEAAIDFSFSNNLDSAEAASFTIERTEGREQKTERVESAFGNGFVFEADAFSDLVFEPSKLFVGTTEQETLENTATVVAILESVRSGKTIGLF